MKAEKSFHLQEEQIISATIDEKELSGEYQQHLLVCPDCKHKVVRLKDELHWFGQKAKEAVPPFSSAVRLPVPKPAAATPKNGWLPFAGAAAMAGLAVFFYFMGPATLDPGKLTIQQSQVYMLEDESLMREISEMVEYPMFEDMYEITGENIMGFDEDFMQFVVPEAQEDFQSEYILQGGLRVC
ncbi:MAG: hypothetical protein R3297_03295 [Desulfobulbales bacterium]|nr:hypothetical protein [Desulfobulbales bacterium]